MLDHLSNRYGRRFVNHWEFVSYAREQGLMLDFTTAPRRPDLRESVKRMLEILDGSGDSAKVHGPVNPDAADASGGASRLTQPDGLKPTVHALSKRFFSTTRHGAKDRRI